MQELLKKLFQESYKRTRWMRVLYILAILVVFVTTYALIIPAITMSLADLPEGFIPKASYTSGAAITPKESSVFTSGAAITLEPTLETYPAQKFTGSAGGIDVSVEADALTFPEGTVMSVTEADPDDILSAVSSVTPGRVTQLQAVDITFYDAEGSEIEPLQPVNVSLSTSDIPDTGDHYVVHVEDNGSGVLMDTDPLPAVSKALKLMRSKAPMAAEPTRNDDSSTFTFETDGFSVYAIATVEPDELDGLSFGILNNQNTVSGTALTTEAVNGATGLKGQTLVVRTDPIGRTDNVFVAKDSNITMWSFENISGSQYYIKAEAEGSVKYLQVTADGVALVDDPTEASPITVTAGTGSYTGKYSFSNGSTYLYLNKGNFVSSTKKDKNTWMNLAELSNLNDEDFVVYTATKVSVSGTVNEDGTIDYDVKDGDQVVIYTRIWNDNTKRYDYYAIDYDGMLVQAYESGDTISWVGSKVNTMMWDFTEYHYDDGTPNYYYELQNTYSGKYIAPQVTGGGAFLSDHTIGINLNGRRNMEYYTTVLAWDDPYYDYASLKVQNMQLTSAPISKADTFYFAVMSSSETGEELGTVETVDNNAYGITVKMQDYPYQGYYVDGGYRSKTQTDILGRDSERTGNAAYTAYEGLLTKNLQDDGYPKTTDVAQNAKGQANVSLGNLFNDTLTVNHQFLMNTYKETGYFEYDCTQNFAHLISSADDPWIGVTDENGHTYEIGDFVVYDQIGTSDLSSKASLQHGQFLPYNDLTENQYSKKNPTNETDLKGNALSSLNPRKGESLYGIPADLSRANGSVSNPKIPPATDVNYFFGMEMSASFMQSESGLDDWGHDLIFEFSGDDDFWLYVDGMLVLDLGGVHSAIDGSINFRTGKVDVNGTQTTLRALYKEAYLENHPDASDETVEAWLDGIFKANEAGEKTVFHDYSGHTMKMFYMERGSQASNLHMRFNLAPYTEGEVLLEKEVSGIEQPDPSMRFPFQIIYHEKDWPEDRYEYAADDISVTDVQTGDPIQYQGSYTVVEGLTYNDVFFLKPGQTASIRFDNEDTIYRIIECGIDTDIYDMVTVNHGDVDVDEKDTPVANRKNYEIVDSSVSGRKKVIYDNQVKNDAQKSLYITKKLWKENEMQNPITDDLTGFKFRVYIGREGTDYTVYNTGKYYVKAPDGTYCIYENGGFVSTGKTVFSDLSTDVLPGEWKSEQEKATFYTSPGGAIDKIPAGYTIEIPGLMSGTDFMVVERDYEIPAGYNLLGYNRVGTIPEGEAPNAGTVRGDHTEVIVNNQHGYGLIVNKIWSDAPFMADHDEIYFAVYLKNEGDDLTLVEDSVRQLGKTDTQILWFFPELEPGKTLNDYLVYEVKLTVPEGGSPTVDPETDIVSGFSAIDRIEEAGTLEVGGNSNEHGYSANYVYTASYNRQMLSDDDIQNKVNSRTDNVSNARPGIKIVKTDMKGKPLEGGVFTLIRGNNQSTKKTFTSDENGLIAVAYLTANEDYTLTEVTAPYKHLSLMESITIRVDTDNTVYVNGQPTPPEGAPYTITQVAEPTASDMPTITVKNKPFALTAVKLDAVNKQPIAGVTFELHREVTDYVQQVPMPDYPPMDEFDALVTLADGTIPKINLDDLSVGTYYLREKSTPLSYKELGFDIRLIIAPTGEISVQKAVYSSEQNKWVFSEFANEGVELKTEENGNLTLIVKNQPSKPVRILKKGYGTDVILSGASFELYKYTQIDQATGLPKEGEHYLFAGTTGADGILELGALERNTTYALIETAAPNGYNLPGAPIIITVMNDGELSAQLNSSALTVETVEDVNTTVSQITVYNSTGYELPSTGGIGDLAVQLPGAVLTLLAAALFGLRRRKYDR